MDLHYEAPCAIFVKEIYKNVKEIRSAINCNECFSAYMYIATKARETGNDPRNIKGFLYDILKEHLIRLFFPEDFDL